MGPLAASLSLAAFGTSAAAFAQQSAPDYPARPIRIIVGLVPGGAIDTIAL